MEVIRHWARAEAVRIHPRDGSEIRAVGIGWSAHHEAEARQRAQERAERLAEQLVDPGYVDEVEAYYVDRPPKEPVIDTLEIEGRLRAAVTRNAYGALVLNAPDAMFLDLDTVAAPPRRGFLSRLLMTGPVEKVKPDRAAMVNHVAGVLDHHPDLGFRLYETAAGYRGLVTNAPFDPEAQPTQDLLTAFGADPLYVTLCRAQSCFRARLTPKPWRCGMPNPPRGFPFTPAVQSNFDAWSREYDRVAANFAVCRFCESFGDPTIHPDLEAVVDWHDRITLTKGTLA